MDIEAKIPINFLQPCTNKTWKHSEHTWKHLESCSCNGSGQEPTMLGYAILNFIKWSIRYAPHRFTQLALNSEDTIQTALDWESKEQRLAHVRREKEREVRYGKENKQVM